MQSLIFELTTIPDVSFLLTSDKLELEHEICDH